MMSVSVLCFYFGLSLQFSPGPLPEATVRINAQKVEVDHEAKRAQLSGNVSVGWGEFTLRAKQVDIQYTDSGTPKSWRAAGEVQVSWRTRVIESNTLFIEQHSDRLIFNGPLVLVEGTQRLRAMKAIFFNQTKRFVIENVSGQMNLKSLVKPK